MTVSPRARRTGFVLALGLFAIGSIVSSAARPALRQAPDIGSASPQSPTVPPGARGAEVVMHGGYPELHVNGEPFFVHSTAFFYYRVPRDLWEVSLDRYRALGINTIDIYIPWNWHELQEGQFDFDGHTNPRRDLRALLKLLAAKNLKLIARPGPLILNEWRYGGFPGWLLERPDFEAAMPAEYRLDNLDLLEGRYPPLAGLNARDAEAAAQAWLANPLYMDYARKWLEAVAHELSPYEELPPANSARAAGAAPAAAPPAKDKPSVILNAPLLFVQLDDDIANGRTNYAGPAVWRYLESLREALRSGGVNVPVFINATDARVSAAGAGLENPIGVMGQWYMRPDRPERETHRRDAEGAEAKEHELTAEDASTIEFYTEELKTQPNFPPALIEYQAGWYAPADDDRPIESDAENTLDSSRLFLAHGLHGISYFPLQDSVTPAGWSVPWANQNYLWNAALDPNGHSRRRADAIERNGEIIMRWGRLLAAAHKRADFGVVYPVGAYGQSSLTAADIRRVSEGVQKIERLAQLDHLSSELLDPEYQPVDQLLRDPMILLPVFDGEPHRAPAADTRGGVIAESSPLQLSEKSQRALVEYVRQGGTLVVFPKRPPGSALAELWKDAPAASAEPTAVISATWGFGAGRVIESSKDFFSWINLKQSFAENHDQEIAAWALKPLRETMTQAGVHPVVRMLVNPASASSLVVTELISNEGTGILGARTGGHGWVSVTNLSGEDTVDASLMVLAPSASSTSKSPERLELDISVPPRESLLLPLAVSLCLDENPAPDCADEASVSSAELVKVAREGKTLELSFYAPARAEILLKLEQAPLHVEVEDSTPETKWSPERHELSLAISRGASPSFRRKLKVQLPYVPHVPTVPRESDRGRGWSELSVVNALRLPLGPTTNLGTSPPLVVVDDPRAVRVTFEASNSDRDFKGDIDVNVTGAYKGSAGLRIPAGQVAVDTAKLKALAADDPARRPAEPDENGLLHGDIEAREGHDRKHLPIFYVPLRAGATTAYRYDFDSDGALEWVLENASVRLIVSPASGGRALALVDKSTGFDLLSSVGALRDGFSFTPNPAGISPERARGRYGLFNRNYEAAWLPDDMKTALSLRYHAADVFPHGADIEKKVELDGDEVSVSYHVALSAANEGAAGGGVASPEDQPQSFIATQSVPALDEPGRLTKFCWSAVSPKDDPAPPKKDSAAQPNETPASASSPAPEAEHCEDFAPGGAALEIPPDANHLEVRTLGRPGLAFDWDAGRLTIEPMRYSALLELHSAVLKPGEKTHATLRFHVLAPD
ncbi:MAG: beta-galactosidase [Candidatus Acidiferrales bacterium]